MAASERRCHCFGEAAIRKHHTDPCTTTNQGTNWKRFSASGASFDAIEVRVTSGQMRVIMDGALYAAQLTQKVRTETSPCRTAIHSYSNERKLVKTGKSDEGVDTLAVRILQGLACSSVFLPVLVIVFPATLNVLGQARGKIDIAFLAGPGLGVAALHLLGAYHLSRRTGSKLAAGCVAFDLFASLLVWIPWVGMFFALLSPLSWIFYFSLLVDLNYWLACAFASLPVLGVGIHFWFRTDSAERARARGA